MNRVEFSSNEFGDQVITLWINGVKSIEINPEGTWVNPHAYMAEILRRRSMPISN